MPTMNSALVNKIKNSWCQETAHPAYASRWSKDNPSAGQCLVTALLIQDELGGDIYDCKVGRSRHFYNVINGEKIDLTFDQFPAGSECKDDRIRDRKSLLSNADTRQRYELLKELVNSNNGINESYQEDKAVQRFGRECREDGLDFFDYEEFSMLIGHNGITPNDHLYRVYVDAYMGNSDSDKSSRDAIGQVLDILYDLSTDEIMEILGNPGSNEVDPHSPMFIIPNGQIVSVGDVTGDHNLGVHIDLFTELIDRIAEQNGLNVPKAEDDDAKLPMEHSLDKLNWARVNCGETWGEDRFYCVLPDTLTNAQARSIEKWLEWGYDSHKERVLIYINNEYIYYYFKDNFPEDIIKKIKRYYSSGRLYENRNELNENMSSVSIKRFIGMTKSEIENELNNLPLGTIITDVRNKSGRYNFDTHIEKKSSYKANTFNPIGSPNDYKTKEEYWTIGGYEKPYIVNEIYDIVNNTSKYYTIHDMNMQESNELEKRAKKHRKKSKGMGWHMAVNAGDVEKGLEVFNNSTSGTCTGGDCGGGMGESLSESSGLSTYIYDGPVYYKGRKISETSNYSTEAPSKEVAARNIWYQVSKNSPDPFNYDIIDERIKLVPGKKKSYDLSSDRPKCHVCGFDINDNGDCPVCDYGELDLLESLSDLEAMWKLSSMDLD